MVDGFMTRPSSRLRQIISYAYGCVRAPPTHREPSALRAACRKALGVHGQCRSTRGDGGAGPHLGRRREAGVGGAAGHFVCRDRRRREMPFAGRSRGHRRCEDCHGLALRSARELSSQLGNIVPKLDKWDAHGRTSQSPLAVRHLRFGPVAEQLLTAAQQTSQAARGSRGRGRRRGRGRGDGGGSANDNAEPSLPPLSAALPDLATLRELFPLPPPGDLTAAPPSAAGPVSAPGPGATPESGVQALTLPPITAPNPGSQAPPLPLLPPLPPLPPLPALQPPPAVQGGQEAVTRRHRERVKEAASWLCR